METNRQGLHHPYWTTQEVQALIERFHAGPTSLVHPQQVLAKMREERSRVGRFNGWLADHIVGMAGTMAFFYFLTILMAAWAFWQAGILHDRGFDPYPFSFLFFMLGGIMQSLFVPTMLTASNRATERDRIKDEADHRAWAHLYEVNEEQLRLLRLLAAMLPQTASARDEPRA